MHSDLPLSYGLCCCMWCRSFSVVCVLILKDSSGNTFSVCDRLCTTKFDRHCLTGLVLQSLYDKVWQTLNVIPHYDEAATDTNVPSVYLEIFRNDTCRHRQKKKITIGCAWKKCKPIASDRPVNGLLSILITRRWLYVLKHCTWTIINYKRTGAPSLMWNSATDMIAQDRHVGLLSTGQPDQVIG